MMKTLQNRQYLSHHHPVLTPIQQHRLNHRLVHHRTYTHHLYCLHKYLCHHYPPPSGLIKILVQGRPVIEIVYICAAQLQEGCCGIHCLRVHTDNHPTGLKTVLEYLLPSPPLFPKPELIQGIVAVL